MKLIGIFGTSGFSREVGDIAYELGYKTIYIAQDNKLVESWTFDDEVTTEQEVLQIKNISFAIGIGDNLIRKKIFNKMSKTLEFTNLIHPSATFGKGQLDNIGKKTGVIICAGVRLTSNIEVGNFNIYNLNSTIGHDVICEDFINIAPGANISGNVHIEENCWIGTGAVINQGDPSEKLRIGRNTIIGSGSVVVKNCENNSTYVGIPAKRIK